MEGDDIAALRAECEELRAARDFYEERWITEERVHRELRDAIRAAGFSTQYFDGRLMCFPESMGECRLRDRLKEVCYDMARMLAQRQQLREPADMDLWLSRSHGYLNKLRAIDFIRYQKEMEPRR